MGIVRTSYNRRGGYAMQATSAMPVQNMGSKHGSGTIHEWSRDMLDVTAWKTPMRR